MKQLLDTIIRSKAENTQRLYRRVLEDWIQFIGDEELALKCTETQDAVRYLNTLREKGAADATIRSTHSVLAFCFTVLHEHGLVPLNIFKMAKYYARKKGYQQVRPTALIDYNQVMAIIDGCDDARDRAIVAMLFGGMLRRSELCSVNYEDIARRDGEYFVRLRKTKNGRGRDQILPTWVIVYVEKYIEFRGRHEGALFQSFHGVSERLCTETIYRIFKKACAKQGIEAAPHSVRATGATMLKEMGYEDRAVADALGHTSSTMVQVYDKRRKLATCAKNLSFPISGNLAMIESQ